MQISTSDIIIIKLLHHYTSFFVCNFFVITFCFLIKHLHHFNSASSIHATTVCCLNPMQNSAQQHTRCSYPGKAE